MTPVTGFRFRSQLCGTAHGDMEETHLHHARTEELQQIPDGHGVEPVDIEDDAISDTPVLTTLFLGIAEPLYGSLLRAHNNLRVPSVILAEDPFLLGNVN
jgi:hypothetical protein